MRDVLAARVGRGHGDPPLPEVVFVRRAGPAWALCLPPPPHPCLLVTRTPLARPQGSAASPLDPGLALGLCCVAAATRGMRSETIECDWADS